MQTKLVYVLTCAPKATYIEQALISIWSACYHNPDAHIVLLVDDKTNELLVGKRAEVLKYISEKIVISFENTTLTPMCRSRWIKTRVRLIIDGDFLFIDSDTICQRPLNDIDNFECEIGAVLESHLLVNEFCTSLHESAQKVCATIGVDVDVERLYFSSGVLYVKDTTQTHKLYELWHQYWLEGNANGLGIDQPSLAKANREIGRVIEQIPDTYNCILFTRPPFVREAHILHIAAFQNPSFLFTNKVLNYVRENGIENEWLQAMILNPCSTILPFDYNLKYSTYMERKKWIVELANAWEGYGETIDDTYSEFPMHSRLRSIVIFLLRNHYNKIAIKVFLTWRRFHLWYTRPIVKPNMCAK